VVGTTPNYRWILERTRLKHFCTVHQGWMETHKNGGQTKTTGHSSPNKSASSTPAALKKVVKSKASDLIADVLKPKHIRPPEKDAQFNYISDITAKWYRQFFYFISTYTCPHSDALVPTFEQKLPGWNTSATTSLPCTSCVAPANGLAFTMQCRLMKAWKRFRTTSGLLRNLSGNGGRANIADLHRKPYRKTNSSMSPTKEVKTDTGFVRNAKKPSPHGVSEGQKFLERRELPATARPH
jgi:hypothetical protein